MPVSTLARLVGAATRRPGPPSMTAARALALSAMRAGQEAAGLQIRLSDVSEDRLTLDPLLARITEPALLYPVSGAPEGRGLLLLCPQAVAGLIEALTLGAVSPRAADDRRPTRTDGAMASGFADVLLRGFGELSEGLEGVPRADPWRTESPFADARAVEMRLGGGPYAVWSATLELAGGAKRGTLMLALPEPLEPQDRLPGSDKTLGHAAMEAEVRLDAVLARIDLPLSRAAGFAPGDLLALPMARIGELQLVGPDGRVVVGAGLGRLGDRRAVRISLPSGGDGKLALAPPDDGRADDGRALDGRAEPD